MVRSRKAPLCKGSCHGEAVTEGLCSCALRKNSGLLPAIAGTIVSASEIRGGMRASRPTQRAPAGAGTLSVSFPKGGAKALRRVE